MGNILNIATSGLSVAQQQLNVIAQNVANATTSGYTRKTLSQNSIVLQGQGSGVNVSTLQRTIDTALRGSLWQQSSQTSYDQISEQYLNQIQQLQGTPDSGSAISGTLNGLKGAFITLSATPDSSLAQTQVVTKATQLAKQFNSLSNSIQQMRNNVQINITDAVNNINTQLTQISDLNQQIVQAKRSGGETASLEDQRDLAIQNIASKLNISTYTTSDGATVVQTANGHLLADTAAHKLLFTQNTLNASTNGNPIYLDDTATDITSSLSGGELGAYLNLRDTALPTEQARLDELAHQVALRFDNQGLKLFTNSAGTVPAAGASPSSTAGYLGFSGQIQVNTAVANDVSLIQKGTTGGTSNPGSVTLISNVIDYTFGAAQDATGTAHPAFNTTGLGAGGNLGSGLVSNADILSYSSQYLSVGAQEYSQTKTNLTYNQTYQDALQKKYSDKTGVSIDSEMTAMINYQRAYGASAKLISIAQDMDNKLFSAVG